MRAGDPRLLGQLQGRLYYYADGEEKELKYRNINPSRDGEDDAVVARTLDEKLELLVEAGADIPADLYLAEMRFCTK